MFEGNKIDTFSVNVSHAVGHCPPFLMVLVYMLISVRRLEPFNMANCPMSGIWKSACESTE